MGAMSDYLMTAELYSDACIQSSAVLVSLKFWKRRTSSSEQMSRGFFAISSWLVVPCTYRCMKKYSGIRTARLTVCTRVRFALPLHARCHHVPGTSRTIHDTWFRYLVAVTKCMHLLSFFNK